MKICNSSIPYKYDDLNDFEHREMANAETNELEIYLLSKANAISVTHIYILIVLEEVAMIMIN